MSTPHLSLVKTFSTNAHNYGGPNRTAVYAVDLFNDKDSPAPSFACSGGDDGVVNIHFLSASQHRPLRCTRPLSSLKGTVPHISPVHSVSSSFCGRYVLSGYGDGGISIFQTNHDGKKISVNSAHAGAVRSVDFGNKSNNLLLTASDDKSMKIWSLNTQSSTASLKFSSSFTTHRHWVRCAKFDKIDCRFISGGDDKSLHLIDIDSRRRILNIDGFFDGGITSCNFYLDSVVVSGGDSSGKICLFDTRQSNLESLVQVYENAHDSAVTSLNFLNDNILISSGPTIKFWDIRIGDVVDTWPNTLHGNKINDVSVKNGLMVSGGLSDEICLYEENESGPHGSYAGVLSAMGSPIKKESASRVNGVPSSGIPSPVRPACVPHQPEFQSGQSPSLSSSQEPNIMNSLLSIQKQLDLVVNSIKTLDSRLVTLEKHVYK